MCVLASHTHAYKGHLADANLQEKAKDTQGRNKSGFLDDRLSLTQKGVVSKLLKQMYAPEERHLS